MSNLFDPFGYDASELSTVAIVMLGCGVTGAVLLGAFIDRTGMFKRSMNVLTFMLPCFTALMILVLSKSDNKALFMSLYGLAGFVGIGYVPLSITYGAELTFPLQPALVNGTLIMCGSISSFVHSLVGTWMFTEGENDHLLSPEDLIEV